MATESDIEQRLEVIQANLHEAVQRSGRRHEEVLVLPASKKQGAEAVRLVADLGLKRFGENRVQEARAKMEELPSDLCWDLIGSLQTNKAKLAVELFEWIHSVDREAIIDELEKRAGQAGKIQKILLEVNVAGEASKQGAPLDQVDNFLERIGGCSHLEIHGFMAMAPFVDDPEKTRPYFARLRELRDAKEQALGWKLPELSMGMSNDYVIAIEEGATIVRLGTALFGPRS
jgi:pyridoxal phosphate enzyme (YggS family)